jgi:putative glutamine amidotransferase
MTLIGLTTYDDKNEEGNPIVALSTHYVNAILRAGGIPVLIPNQVIDTDLEDLYARLDGLLFTGGGDISINWFMGEPHPQINRVNDERDGLELPLLRAAARDGKPFLGICRGLQVVNVSMGGTLYTHIPDQLPGAVKHDWHDGYPRNHPAHPVRVEEGSRLAHILAEPVLDVNSLHHQGIKDLAPGLKAVAFAPDGLVEAIELPEHPFGLAVQWHPEWLVEQESAQRLFQAFVDAARR